MGSVSAFVLFKMALLQAGYTVGSALTRKENGYFLVLQKIVLHNSYWLVHKCYIQRDINNMKFSDIAITHD